MLHRSAHHIFGQELCPLLGRTSIGYAPGINGIHRHGRCTWQSMVEIWIPLLVRHEKSRKNSEDPGSPGTTRAWKDFLKNLPRCGCPASTAHQTLRHAEHLGTLTRQVRPSSDYGKNMRCQHPRAKSWLRSLANLAKNRKPSTKMKNNVNMFAFDLTDPYGLGAVAIDYHLQLLLRR